MKIEPWRGRAFECTAEVRAQSAHEAGQQLLRLHAPEVAANAKPGQFVHLRVDEELPLRRPFSILRADPNTGTIDLYYRIVGRGTALLARRKRGDRLRLLGPIGRPFALHRGNIHLLLGGGVGLPPVFFAAHWLAAMQEEAVLFVGAEHPLPFPTRPSRFLLAGVQSGAILALEEIEALGIACRIASRAGLFGCYEGFVTELAEEWLASLTPEARERVVILACGPEPMLQATARLARALQIPAQLALEARMACAIGGCAGCVVATIEEGKRRFRRVCVDGPVFPAEILAEFTEGEH